MLSGMARELWSLPGEGEQIWFVNALVTIKVPGEAVDGRLTLIEFLMPQGTSPPRHFHPQDETFTMIDGTLTFMAGDQRFVCDAGASWIVPSGVEHTFRVESETAKLVAVYAPAGMDRCFRLAGLPAESPTLPPPDAPTRPFDEIEAILAANSHHNVGPPMGPDD
jgi:quercetin dioxygenase-like cupin family protein